MYFEHPEPHYQKALAMAIATGGPKSIEDFDGPEGVYTWFLDKSQSKIQENFNAVELTWGDIGRLWSLRCPQATDAQKTEALTSCSEVNQQKIILVFTIKKMGDGLRRRISVQVIRLADGGGYRFLVVEFLKPGFACVYREPPALADVLSLIGSADRPLSEYSATGILIGAGSGTEIAQYPPADKPKKKKSKRGRKR